MLNDAYQAVTVTGSWPFLKNFSGESFMFSNDPAVHNIMNAMTLRDDHSGASFGLTMRAMQYIALHGWDAYREARSGGSRAN